MTSLPENLPKEDENDPSSPARRAARRRDARLKCDRNLPCENCSTRGRGATCVYANPPPPGQTRGIRRPVDKATMQSRVQHLEEIVLSLVQEESPASSQSRSTPESRSDGEVRGHRVGYHFGNDPSGSTGPGSSDDPAMPIVESAEPIQNLSLPSGGDSRYFESGHWNSILADIGELKGYFADQGEVDVSETTPEASHCETDLLSGRCGRLTQMEILDRVPPRPLVDFLITRYFNSNDQPLVVIHRPSFRKEYDLFWEDPWSAPIIWVSKLFSMMCSSIRIVTHSGEQMPESLLDPDQQMDQYRQLAVHCLFAGNYATGPPHAVEALILYFFTEYTRTPDMQLPCWLLFGVVLRISMRKGYHRDARHHPGLSILEGEMRRRSWTILFHMDLLTSVDASLPRMIQPSQMDSDLPRCIRDEDIDETTIELPPSRPDVANPLLAFTIVKRALVIVFGTIVDLNNTKEFAPYEKILQLDKALQDSCRVIPTTSEANPTEPAVAESPGSIRRRLMLDLMYQKARCMLHRKYYTLSWNNLQYMYSRQTCIEAAMTTLRQQAVLHQELQPGGMLHQFKWMKMSLIAHESLLSAMILCMYLDRLNQQSVGGVGDIAIDNMTPERRSEMLHLLESAVMYIILQKVGLMLPMPNNIMNEIAPLDARAHSGLGTLTAAPTIPTFHPHDGVYTQTPPIPVPIPISEMGLIDPEDMFFSPEIMTIRNFIQFPQEIDWNEWDNSFRLHDWSYSFNMSQMGE
ncbi:C6 transcription factor [Histoplasma capsulatum var. duboisii H88]|uniref:C6 transcription factor n=1 Tax=Ajellomyces capsulatus (strain H88) TaxID=544711 RepID=F0UFI0_AJEC8|nr:C6 transcription factor [Histoplasma capsulatum var. duboisii H88]